MSKIIITIGLLLGLLGGAKYVVADGRSDATRDYNFETQTFDRVDPRSKASASRNGLLIGGVGCFLVLAGLLVGQRKVVVIPAQV